MPQIAQIADTFASQVLWMLVFFGFVFFVVGRGMLPKVMATVDARDGQIAADLAAADQARKAADAEEESWRTQFNARRAESHALIAQAKAEAAKAAEIRLAEAGARIDSQVSEAEAKIATARASAMGEIEAVAADAASDIVARLTGASVDAKAARAAVTEALNG